MSDDLISRQAVMKEFADFVRRPNNSDFANTPTWNDAVSLVGSMPSAQQWIPCSERLPSEYTRVIGYMAWKAITAIEYQNGRWYSVDHLEPLPDEAVTHWMPLPTPPEVQE